MSQVTSDAESVSAPAFGSDPSPRSAALRFGLGSLNPGPKASRAPPVASAGEPSPLRCPREGRCGAEAPVAHASSQVLGSRRRGFPRVAVSRLAPLRCARSTRPPLGPLGDRRRQRQAIPSGLSRRLGGRATHLRARERPAHAAQSPCKRFWGTFAPPPHSRKGPALEGAQNGLERLWRIPASDPAPSFREGRRRLARECDDVHSRNARVDLHSAPDCGSIEPSPQGERNSPDLPPQSSGGLTARPEELTRNGEIPSQLGGSAST